MTKPIVLVGEAKGEQEAKINSSFVGAAGVELLRMLDEAGIITLSGDDYDNINLYYRTGDPHKINEIWLAHPEVYRTNVFQLHPRANKIETLCASRKEAKESNLRLILDYPPLTKGRFVLENYRHELERLGDELLDLDPNVVVCLGNTPLWALTGQVAISKRRGTTYLSTHTAAGFKLLPTYHPAAVLRQWELRPTTLMDLMKAHRENEYAEIRRPKREIWIEPTIADIETFIRDHIIGCEILAVDIETAGNRVTCIGLSPHKGLSLVIPFDDSRRKGRSFWPTSALELAAWVLIRGVLEDKAVKKVFQNGLYDIAFLWRANQIKVYGATEDTMLLHHALQPESLKSLGFLGSIYTSETAWKLDRRVSTIKRDE